MTDRGATDREAAAEQARRLARVDDRRLASAWSGSGAKQRLLEETMSIIDRQAGATGRPDEGRTAAPVGGDPRRAGTTAPRRSGPGEPNRIGSHRLSGAFRHPMGRLAIATLSVGALGLGVVGVASVSERIGGSDEGELAVEASPSGSAETEGTVLAAGANGTLLAASAAAAEQAAAVPGEGQYLYRKTQRLDAPSEVADPPASAYTLVTSEAWLGTDGSFVAVHEPDLYGISGTESTSMTVTPDNYHVQRPLGPDQYASLLGVSDLGELFALAQEPESLHARMVGFAEQVVAAELGSDSDMTEEELRQFAEDVAADDPNITADEFFAEMQAEIAATDERIPDNPVSESLLTQETVFIMATDLLGWSPALDQALYDLLNRLPDVQEDGPWVDDLGRQGEAVSLTLTAEPYEEQLSSYQLIIDPETGQLLSSRRPMLSIEEERQLAPDAEERAFDSEIFILAQGIVDSPQERP